MSEPLVGWLYTGRANRREEPMLFAMGTAALATCNGIIRATGSARARIIQRPDPSRLGIDHSTSIVRERYKDWYGLTLLTNQNEGDSTRNEAVTKVRMALEAGWGAAVNDLDASAIQLGIKDLRQRITTDQGNIPMVMGVPTHWPHNSLWLPPMLSKAYRLPVSGEYL